MKDLFMFKITTALENEEEKEKTNVFGFKLKHFGTAFKKVKM